MTQNQQEITQISSFNSTIGRSQISVLARSLTFAGIGFLLICAFGYLINYLLLNPQTINNFDYLNNIQTLNTTSSILLVLTIVYSMVYMFIKPSFWSAGIMYFLVIATFSISFGFIFTCYDLGELIFVFSLAGISLIICGIVGYCIKDKTAFTLTKILFGLFIGYFIFTLVFLLVSVFVYGNNQWLSIFLTILIMSIIFIGNICTFYQIKKIDEFSQTFDPKASWLISFQLGVSLLISIINTILILLRLLRIFGFSSNN